MRILVTGSTGFIGGALCRALVEAGHEVRAFHRASSSLRLIEDLPVEHAIGDLTQAESVRAAMQGVEVVFHAAAMLGASDHPGRLYAVTVEGTRSLLLAAREAGVRRVVHTSSVAALGVPEAAGSDVPVLLDESHTWNYRPQAYPYGYAKYLAELEVQNAVAQGQDVVMVNPSLVIGAGDIYRQTSSLVVQLARQKLGVMIEGGANFVHLADVVAGHLAALERGERGQRYILGGENLTFVKFAEKAAQVAGVNPPGVVLPSGLVRLVSAPAHWLEPFLNLPVSGSMLALAGRYFYYDTRRAQVELGLDLPRPVDSAIAEAYAWFVQMGAIPARK